MQRLDLPNAAPVWMWQPSPLETPQAHMIGRMAAADDVARIAVMPDVHLASEVCVGTAIATRRLLYPQAVGGDIGCGMLAMRFDLQADALRQPAAAGQLLRLLQQRIPIMRHHRDATAPWPDSMRPQDLSSPSLASLAGDDGRLQLGTLGGGNHFVEIQADHDDAVWLMIHSGSRAMGQAIRAFHLSGATRGSGGLFHLDLDVDAGQAYLNDVNWARQYADESRRAMAKAVAEAIKSVFAAPVVGGSTIAVDHNHVAVEQHDEGLLLVHRKGAMPADAGSLGVVPGSMGTQSFHVEGRGCEQSLRSSAHGAGRRFSRGVARERFTRRDLQREMTGVWFDPKLADALRDEAPRAYKDVRSVMKAQSELVRVVRTLRPLLVHKGGGGSG